MIVLPSWYGDLQKKLKKIVEETALKNDINYHLVGDSNTIDRAVSNICNSLNYISECRHPLQPRIAEEPKKKKRKK